MGNKESKDGKGGKNSKVPIKSPSELSDADYKIFYDKTGMTKEQCIEVLTKFTTNNPGCKLNRAEFMKLYATLRNEPVQNLDEITNFVFNGK
jgi:hypothetical protein